MQYIAGGGALGTPSVMGPCRCSKEDLTDASRIRSDLNTGDHAWMVPNGKPADTLVSNPALKAARH